MTSSLATRVTRAPPPAGDVRTGGFGGHEGLAEWIRAHDVAAVLDARIPSPDGSPAPPRSRAPRAALPCCASNARAGRSRPDDRWHWVDDLPQAAAALAPLGTRVLLTTGRQGLSAFASSASAWFLVRCIEPPDPPLPPRHQLLLDRGPYTVDGELALIDEHRLDLVVTKDSGGDHTAAKLEGRPPPRPAGAHRPSPAAARRGHRLHRRGGRRLGVRADGRRAIGLAAGEVPRAPDPARHVVLDRGHVASPPASCQRPENHAPIEPHRSPAA